MWRDLSLPILQTLVEGKANVNASDRQQNLSPLLCACRYGERMDDAGMRNLRYLIQAKVSFLVALRRRAFTHAVLVLLQADVNWRNATGGCFVTASSMPMIRAAQ